MSDDNYTNGRVCENRVGNDAVLNGQVSSFGEVSRHVTTLHFAKGHRSPLRAVREIQTHLR